MKKHFTVLGSMTFLEKRCDGVDKTIINRIDDIRMLTESEAEKLIDDMEFDCYFIPELYKGDVEYIK